MDGPYDIFPQYKVHKRWEEDRPDGKYIHLRGFIVSGREPLQREIDEAFKDYVPKPEAFWKWL